MELAYMYTDFEMFREASDEEIEDYGFCIEG